jgi:hypothetical protein
MRFGPFLGLSILLLFLWIGGLLMLHTSRASIHLLLLFAVNSFMIHLFATARTA